MEEKGILSLTPEISEGAAWKGERTSPGTCTLEGRRQDRGRELQVASVYSFKALLEHPHARVKQRVKSESSAQTGMEILDFGVTSIQMEAQIMARAEFPWVGASMKRKWPRTKLCRKCRLQEEPAKKSVKEQPERGLSIKAKGKRVCLVGCSLQETPMSSLVTWGRKHALIYQHGGLTRRAVVVETRKMPRVYLRMASLRLK